MRNHRGRLSSIFASSSSTASSTASTSALANLLRALPPAYAVFKERLLSGKLGTDDARHLFDQVLRGCDQANAPNALLSALARAPPSAAFSDGPALAVELFRRMDRCASALSLFRDILHKGVALTSVAYNIIIHGLFQAGRTNTAKKMFNEMIDCGMTVSNATYNIVLGGLCRNNCTDEAIMLLDKLFAGNIKFDILILI
ncbi:hypothetical protein GUJ93_ZPchr0857g1 [Zizania palustris]|uniref:Pentatricopeptide repeat-containing protein n=1 Tax=Zizania palustris TaxID=103762 RepID=A0A8J5V2W6_ZIZPA|nr:hypothetical protein GUJ93_ZPchr0857g1 [Zizania palustris]